MNSRARCAATGKAGPPNCGLPVLRSSAEGGERGRKRSGRQRSLTPKGWGPSRCARGWLWAGPRARAQTSVKATLAESSHYQELTPLQEKVLRAARPERRLRIEEPDGIATFFIFFRQIAYRGLGSARRL